MPAEPGGIWAEASRGELLAQQGKPGGDHVTAEDSRTYCQRTAGDIPEDRGKCAGDAVGQGGQHRIGVAEQTGDGAIQHRSQALGRTLGKTA